MLLMFDRSREIPYNKVCVLWVFLKAINGEMHTDSVVVRDLRIVATL